jgi:hypothetical protein
VSERVCKRCETVASSKAKTDALRLMQKGAKGDGTATANADKQTRGKGQKGSADAETAKLVALTSRSSRCSDRAVSGCCERCEWTAREQQRQSGGAASNSSQASVFFHIPLPSLAMLCCLHALLLYGAVRWSALCVSGAAAAAARRSHNLMLHTRIAQDARMRCSS